MTSPNGYLEPWRMIFCSVMGSGGFSMMILHSVQVAQAAASVLDLTLFCAFAAPIPI